MEELKEFNWSLLGVPFFLALSIFVAEFYHKRIKSYWLANILSGVSAGSLVTVIGVLLLVIIQKNNEYSIWADLLVPWIAMSLLALIYSAARGATLRNTPEFNSTS